MATRAPEELDGGLGACEAGADPSAEPCPGRPREDKAGAAAMARLTDLSGWPHGPQEPEAEGAAGGVDTKPKKLEKEPQVRRAPSPAKERPRAGASPRSAPARKKAQSAPPPQPPPPPPSEELPWGDLTLNQCLVLASLLALLGSAVQLGRDALAGEVPVPTPAPEPWVPPSAAPKEQEPPPPEPAAWAPAAEPPAPHEEAEERPEAPADGEAAEAEAAETSGEDDAPLGDPGPQEKRPGRERRKEARPRKEERPRRARRPRASGEPRALGPRRWEARELGRRPGVRDSGAPERRRGPGRASPGSRAEGARALGRQPRRAGGAAQ